MTPTPLSSPEANHLFTRLARTYSWDMPELEARNWLFRLIRRVMDLGTLDDIVAMEQVFGRDILVHAITTAEAGAMRPKSWAFWHYRLNLIRAGADCPPMPARRVA